MRASPSTKTAGWRWFRPSQRRGWTSTRRWRRSREGLLAGEDEIALVVDETPAKISDAMAAAAVERGEDLLDPGITLDLGRR